MTAWPYIHSASAAITPEGQISVAGPEPAAVTTTGFDLAGVGDMGSPQTLMICAVAWSFAAAFRREAAASCLPWDALDLGADGTVDRNRGGPRFARFDLTLDIQAPTERAGALRQAAERALRQCLATNSLIAPAHVATRVHDGTRGRDHGPHAVTPSDPAPAHG